jgi:hypothetical protein
MDFLSNYFETQTNSLLISGQQGSDFAKRIAGDFNPIHDVGSKRFCVPGDLLFAVALSRYGLHQEMTFRFRDMVKADSELVYADKVGDGVSYANGKAVLDISASGDSINDPKAIESLLRKYVAFSGQNFPHILVPLMEEHQVMINPARPLVIYESMSFDLDTLKFDDLDIRLEETSLSVEGKRGNAVLNFSFNDKSGQVGRGAKKLVLSGLRPYEPDAVQAMCDEYLAFAK